MVEKVKVAVVGGGIVGCAVLYGLAKRGWQDLLLLERLELTAGSTWHAAGNITHFGHYAEISRLYADSLETYLQAERESGQSVGFHKTGSLRLATTEAELAAYRRIEGLFAQIGVPYRVVTPRQIAELHPLVETEGLFGAAHTPADGHVDPSGATHAMVKAARALGAQVWQHCPVRSLAADPQGGWRLETERGQVQAREVVLTASFWTRALAMQVGLDLPLYALEHHEVVTDDIPELEALGFELPTLRDPAAPANTRQERQALLCGVYEREPKLWATEGIPEGFGRELLVPDLERLEDHLLKVIDRIPAFGRAGIKTVNNGPLCFTPDGCPLVGPVRSHASLWLAAGFPVGIGTGGGSGKYLAAWMVEGRAPYPLPIIDPARFASPPTKAEALARITETYAMGYATPDVKAAETLLAAGEKA